MTNVVHTCEECGEHLPVPDRYFGRPLRCPSCGEVFTVEVPAASEPSPPVPAPMGTPKSWRRWWWWVVALAPLVAAVVWLSLPRDPSDPLFSRQVFPGQVLTVVGAVGGDGPCGAIDRRQVEALVRMADGGSAGVGAMPPGVVRISPGTRVSVRENRRAERVVVVRVVDGPWSGRELWVPAAWLE